MSKFDNEGGLKARMEKEAGYSFGKAPNYTKLSKHATRHSPKEGKADKKRGEMSHKLATGAKNMEDFRKKGSKTMDIMKKFESKE